MKISYVHGPGDAYGTFLKWQAGNTDASINKQTYSGQFFDLITALDGQGQVICSTESGATGDPRFGFSTVPSSRKSGWRYYLGEMRYAFEVGQKLRAFDPDVIIISSDFPSQYFDLLPRKPKKILSIHNTFWPPYGSPQGTKARLLTSLTRRALRNINLAVCVSRECQRQFQDLRSGSETFSVVQLPRVAMEPLPRPEKKDGAPKVLLYVGRVEQSKGVGDLIRAFKTAHEALGGISLKIVGDGGYLDRCRRLANELQISEHVSFTGRLDAHGVRRAYAEADFCVCPSRPEFCEGLATVPIEAAVHGTPSIISSAVPAKEYFAVNELVFTAGNSEDLAAKIRLALTSAEIQTKALADTRQSLKKMFAEHGDWKSGIVRCIESNTG